MNQKKSKRTDPILSQMIIERIKTIRKNHNHSQEYIYENTGLDLAHIEIGRVVPSVISLSTFCKLYNITLDEFFAPLKYPHKK